jgi:hypothetical protein
MFAVLAIMVDLGWPWWVTTLIAAGVALLAALAFARTRGTTIRAVAALVVLEAVAIAVIAPFVMDDADDTNGGPAMSSSPLSSTDFVRKADANCSELNAFIATLGNPKTPAGVERQMDRLLPEFWRKILAQGELEAPPDRQATAGQWMNAMGAFGRDYEALRAAASRRDAKAMERANASAGEHAKESARLSKELGLGVCFQ